MKEFFTITSVSREDLESIGFDPSKVDDETMERLADMMSTYASFWDDLEMTAEYLNIPQKKQSCIYNHDHEKEPSTCVAHT